MKTVFITIFLITIIGCSQRRQPDRLINNEDYFIDFSKGIYPLKDSDITLKTIKYRDDKNQIDLEIYIPVIHSDSVFSAYISEEIQKQKQDFVNEIIKKVDEDSRILTSVGSFFEAYPVTIYKSLRLISVCYTISKYTAGNAHPITKYQSFNFDRKNLRFIAFDDFFSLSSILDSISLKQLINKAINRENIGIQNIYKMDFCIIQDSISFNFSDYEIASYAEGIIQGRILKQELLKHINKIYR